MLIDIDMGCFEKFFGIPGDAELIIIIPPSIVNSVHLCGNSTYHRVQVIAATVGEIPDTIAGLCGSHHIFCITIDKPFQSPSPSAVAGHKLAVLPMFSTGFTLDKLRYSLDLIPKLDYDSQKSDAEQLVQELSSAEEIEFAWPDQDVCAHLIRMYAPTLDSQVLLQEHFFYPSWPY